MFALKLLLMCLLLTLLLYSYGKEATIMNSLINDFVYVNSFGKTLFLRLLLNGLEEKTCSPFYICQLRF